MAITPSELFVPITASAAVAPELANDVLHQRNARDFQALLRLAPGVTTESAEAGLGVITRQLDEQDPSAPRDPGKATSVTLLAAGTVAPISKTFRKVAIGFFLALMGLIMTIASMNLANMLLARGANRHKELAIRLAIGASRFCLIRQMMTEGILLSLLGGVAGFALGYGLCVLNSQFTEPLAIPEESDFTPDWHVAVFLFALAIVCGITFSILPALRATRSDLTPALKEGSALQLPGYRRIGLRNVLMVAQVAGSLMLLLITGFLVLGISKASKIQTKFDAHTLVLLSLDPVRDGYSPEKSQTLFEELPQQLKPVAAVRSLGLTAQRPFSSQPPSLALTAEGGPGASQVSHMLVRETIGAGYFAALDEPMASGREFTETDQRISSDGTNTLPIVLNEHAARQFFGAASAIGKRVRADRQSYEVVGIAPDLKNGMGLTQSVIYLPLTRNDFARPPAGGITVMVRTAAGADALNAVRREIALLDPSLNTFHEETLSQYLDMSRAYELYSLDTYGGIGIFGLILAAIGLAGVTAYAVAQRRKEIGIRMALGARKSQVLGLVLREGAALVSIGTALGFLGAFALAKAAAAMTDILVDAFKFGTNDPRLLVGAPLLLAALALLACYVPARKAAQIDPLKALRQE